MSSSNFASSKVKLALKPNFCFLQSQNNWKFMYLFTYRLDWFSFRKVWVERERPFEVINRAFIHSQATWASIVHMGIWTWTWGQILIPRFPVAKNLQQICTPSRRSMLACGVCWVFILQIISASTLMEIPLLFSGASGKLSLLKASHESGRNRYKQKRIFPRLFVKGFIYIWALHEMLSMPIV